MADSSNSIIAPGANPLQPNPSRFQSRIDAYIYARNRYENLTEDADDTPEGDLFYDAMVAAERALVREPATCISDLRAKAEVFWSDGRCDVDDENFAHLLGDLRRLTKGEPSRVFSADLWLNKFERLGGMWLVRDEEAILLAPLMNQEIDIVAALYGCGGEGLVKSAILERHAAKAMLEAGRADHGDL